MDDATFVSQQILDISSTIGTTNSYTVETLFGVVHNLGSSVDNLRVPIVFFVIGSSILSIATIGVTITTLIQVNKKKKT